MKDLSSSRKAYECLRAQLNPYVEEVWVLALNSQLELLKMEMVFRGTADSCLLHPRDIFRVLILNNACSFILGHNHPSENPTPSVQDLKWTRQLFSLSRLAQIPMHDHIIVTSQDYFSMRENGYFKKWKK